MSSASSPIGKAIGQRRPFRSVRQEGLIALLVTADAVRRGFSDLLGRIGNVTSQQYNVLRILRGAEPEGLATLEIAERMIERTPGVTRLLDRLERKGLITRARPAEDRRRVICRISPAGLALLERLAPQVEAADERALEALDETEAARLVELLARVLATQP